MKRTVQVTVLLTTLLMSGMTLASTIKDGTLNQLMELSGIQMQTSEIPAGIIAGMQQSRKNGSPLSDEQYTQIEKVVSSSFSAEEITAQITKNIKSDVSESEAQELLKWYKTDLGKKITQAEKNGSSPSAYQEMSEQAGVLLQDKERVEIAQRIDRLANLSDLSLEFHKNTAKAIFASLSKAMNPNQKVHFEAFESKLAANEPAMRQQVNQLVVLSLVYNYKDISISDMNKYLEFLEKPATKEFNDSAIKGMKTALNQSITKMAESLAAVFTAKK